MIVINIITVRVKDIAKVVCMKNAKLYLSDDLVSYPSGGDAWNSKQSADLVHITEPTRHEAK